MKSIINQLFVVAAWLFSIAAGNAQVFDDFSDGDFTNTPEWTGDQDNFEVNVDFELQLADDEATTSSLLTSFSSGPITNKEWRFWIRHSFSGSDNNQSRFYLSTTTGDISYTGTTSAGAQGYYIRIGESGSDDAISLFRDDLEGESVTLVAQGVLGTVSSSFDALVKVILEGEDWTIWADFGDGFELQGSGTDGTYTESTGLGLSCKYTVSNADNIYLDDVYFGDIEVDDTPPESAILQVINANELLLTMTEAIEENSAENTSNYNVPGTGAPSSAVLDDDQVSISLTFGNSFPENIEQILEVSELEDLSANVMVDEQLPFTWVPIVSASARDVVFNELLPDPTPAIGLPEAEFIELFNASESAFDLDGWTLINTETEKSLDSFVLTPGAFILLCDDDDVALFEEFGDVIGIDAFTALSNSGDSLTLRNELDEVVDIVVYNDGWYGNSQLAEGGTTLEQVNPFAQCSGENNWTASSDASGGTPGEQNSEFDETLDDTPPLLEGLTIEGDNLVYLHFNEWLDQASYSSASFTMTEGVLIDAVNTFEDQIIALTFDQILEVGVTYELTISDVADCEGNAINPEIIIPVIIGFTPEPGDLIMNEIMPDPDESLPSPNAEYVELYNPSALTLDLQGVNLSGAIVTQQLIIEAEGYVVLASEGDELSFLSWPGVHFLDDFPGLVNTGRDLVLTNAEGVILDSLSYDLSWYGDEDKDDGGYSLELINPEDPCSDASNWGASNDASGATPLTVNSLYNTTPDSQAPSYLYVVTLNSDQIELIFIEPLDEASVITSQYEFLEIFDGQSQPSELSISDIELLGNSIILTFDGTMLEGILYQIDIDGIEDCWANPALTVSAQFALGQEAEAGDVIINEILSNPSDGASDYVELYNRSSKVISLKDWMLANVDDGIVDNFKLISEIDRLLFPGEFMCLSTDVQVLPDIYPFAVVENLLQIESMPSYNNDEGTVMLMMPNALTSDSAYYHEDMHFSLLNDLDGVALERLSYERASGEATNWLSAAESQNFGTPGYENSQWLTGGLVEGELTVDPEVFSPDNDGFQDVVTVSYQFDIPGQAANVTIYDKIGRDIRKLANNDLLGTQGSYSWDGTTERGDKAPMGIYIIHFEVFDLEGNVNHFKETCVLGHQLD